MRRAILGWGSILLIISMAVISYAGMEKVAISKDNLADLKGIWRGDRSVGPGHIPITDLEILNDSLPLQGKFTFYEVRAPGRPPRTVAFDFKKGRINKQGNLLIGGGGDSTEIELSLYKDDGKMKLEGKYFWYGEKGTMSLKKK